MGMGVGVLRCAQVMPPKISKADFDRVLIRARPTVGKDDLKVYEDFTNEFGEDS